MGFDCGFDISPRLEATPENIQLYKLFIDEVVHKYRDVYDEKGNSDDGKVLRLPTDQTGEKDVCIRFMVGECPAMPSNPARCDYFLRFSSKVSGNLTAPAESYIRGVYKIGQKHLGTRVHYWHEMSDTGDEREWGVYNWEEIRAAEKALRELEGR